MNSLCCIEENFESILVSLDIEFLSSEILLVYIRKTKIIHLLQLSRLHYTISLIVHPRFVPTYHVQATNFHP